MAQSYEVIIWLDDNGAYSAKCPSLPGCYSCGDTVEEAQANIREAIHLYLDTLRKHRQPIPERRPVMLVEVAA